MRDIVDRLNKADGGSLGLAEQEQCRRCSGRLCGTKRVMNLALKLMQKRPVIRDGDTVGATSTQLIMVRGGQFGGTATYRLEFTLNGNAWSDHGSSTRRGASTYSLSRQGCECRCMAWVIYFPLIERWLPEIIGAPRDGPGARTVLPPDIPTWKRDLSYRGTPFEPHEVRREFWLHGSHRDFGDVFPVCAYWGCTAEWRQEVEALEPGVHQFFPIVIRRARSQRPIWRLDGREAVDGDFFLFNCLQLLDAVLLERSSGPLVKRYEDGRLGFSPRSDDLCVSQAVVAGRHIWRDGRNLVGAHFFVSDALMERFRAAGLKGFEAKRVREE